MANANGIQVVFGLGNPGPKYDQTRHNAGFWFVDALASAYGGVFRQEAKFAAQVCRIRVAGQALWLVKPQTYMNHSGRSVRTFNHFYRLDLEASLVVHDEIDLPPGRVKLKQGGGHGGHNGLRDIFAQCGQAFLRLRLGVGHPGQRDNVIGYVLERPTRAEEQAIIATIEASTAVVPLLLEGQVERAMTRLHTFVAAPPEAV